MVTVWTTNLGGTLSWTATGGTPTSGSGSSFSWGAPASGVVRISVSNGSLSAYRDVLVVTYSTTVKASIPLDGSVDDITLTHTMESGGRKGRRKASPKRRWELAFRKRTVTEYNTVVSLFNTVGKLEPFLMADPVTNVNTAWYFDSAISVRYNKDCSVEYSFRVVEA